MIGTIDASLAFDDVLLLPCHSDVLPRECALATHLTDAIVLQVPIVCAAMDTVTESAAAIAIAQVGGLGFVHKNLDIARQAAEVGRVKAVRGEVPAREAASSAMAKEGGPRPAGGAARPACDVASRYGAAEWPAAGNQAPAQDSRLATRDELGRLRVGAAVGVGGDRESRLAALVEAGVDVIAIDTAHGHSRGVLEAVSASRRAYPTLSIVAGNVATAEATRALLDAGADTVKVGIGPGSICTTRVVAGVGVPQFSAVLACAEAARQGGGRVIADGGVRYSGDLVKALAAGAAVVMVGSLLAGTDEAPGEVIVVGGRQFKAYRGMGSLGAMVAGSAERYFQASGDGPRKLVPEGVEGLVPCRGPLRDNVHRLTGGLRSGMGYLGAADLGALRRRAHFVRISAAGVRESHVHDVALRGDDADDRPPA